MHIHFDFAIAAGLMFLIAIAAHALGLFATIAFRLTPIRKLNSERGLPGVTILKPCKENDDNEEENFAGFFTQDYAGPLEILFVVASYSHPIVPVVRRTLAKYPHVNARLVLSETRMACSPKINSLYDGHRESQQDIIIWSDSDVIVEPNYVSQMVACLQEKGVSVVTTPQYDARPNTFGSGFKVLANNCDLAVFVMTYWLFKRRIRVAWGHSCGFWKREFDSFGEKAWEFLSKFLADDLGLPQLFDNHDRRVVFRNIYCPVETSNKTVAQMVEQKKRWVMCQRLVIGNRLIYLTGLLFYPEIPATLYLAATGGSRLGWLALAIAIGTRIGIAAIFEMLYLNSLRMTLRYFWAVPLWDFSQVYFFFYAFTTDHITFRGQRYRILPDYSLAPEVNEVVLDTNILPHSG